MLPHRNRTANLEAPFVNANMSQHQKVCKTYDVVCLSTAILELLAVREWNAVMSCFGFNRTFF